MPYLFPIEQPAVPGRYSKTKAKLVRRDGVNAVSTLHELSMDYRKIKEIGRGKNHARDLDLDTARGFAARYPNAEWRHPLTGNGQYIDGAWVLKAKAKPKCWAL